MYFNKKNLHSTYFIYRTCRPSMSNVLTDFISLPGVETSSSTSPTTSGLAATGKRTRSQSLIGKVRRGGTTLFRQSTNKSKPKAPESFDLVEQRDKQRNQNEEEIPRSNVDDEDEETKKSCLKASTIKESSGADTSILSSAVRTVSFDARADPESDPLFNGINKVANHYGHHGVGSGNGDARSSSASATAVLKLAAATATTATNSRLDLRAVQNCNERRRLFEDNLAAVCMGFVLVFLLCHFPRLLLNIHELITIKEAMMCGEQGHHPFSVWSMITTCISHFLLVLNSATNILVYCLLSSKFREECSKIIRRQPTPQCFLDCFFCPKSKTRRSAGTTRSRNGNRTLLPPRPSDPHIAEGVNV